MKIKDSKWKEIASVFSFFFFFKSQPDGRLSVISISHHATNLQNAAERCGGRTLEINETQKMGLKKKEIKSSYWSWW